MPPPAHEAFPHQRGFVSSSSPYTQVSYDKASHAEDLSAPTHSTPTAVAINSDDQRIQHESNSPSIATMLLHRQFGAGAMYSSSSPNSADVPGSSNSSGAPDSPSGFVVPQADGRGEAAMARDYNSPGWEQGALNQRITRGPSHPNSSNCSTSRLADPPINSPIDPPTNPLSQFS